MKFTKMQGLGNDYLYVFGEVPENIKELSIRLSDRHFGAGSDGMIYILKSEVADFKMRIFNADGSEAKMCGNGIRCVGKYVYDRGYTDKTQLDIETLSGIKKLYLNLGPEDGRVKSVRVDMGQVNVGNDVDLKLDADKITDLKFTCVDVGNPHAVAFVEDVHAVELEITGPQVEHHKYFTDGVNAEFVQVSDKNELRMRVWERGSGITMACGTGACASAAAAVSKGFCMMDEPITVHLDGGDLVVRVYEDYQVEMTGPAEFVYDAQIL